VTALALLLAAIGSSDLARSRLPGRSATAAAFVIGTAVFVLGALGTGVDWWWWIVAAALVAAWLRSTRQAAGGWVLVGAAVVVAAAIVFSPALAAPSGVIVDWYSALPYALASSVPFEAFALAVGGTAFLFETSNVIVRSLLRRALVAGPDPTTAVEPRRRFRRRAVVTAPPTVAPLRGGRIIGPLERVFLLALVLVGAYPAIAALIAAKGIIRFPEISKDDVGGSKAEYFLVGSFASWALVLLIAVLVGLQLPLPAPA
jgi:hypothetical protein